MALSKRLMAVGVSAEQAKAINGQVVLSLSGAGSTQATATAITGDVNIFTTVGANTGAILPSDAGPGDWVEVVNYGANPLLVYPAVGGKIQNGSANASFSHTNGKTGTYTVHDGLNWTVQLSA